MTNEDKIMTILIGDTLRSIVNNSNELGIKKEDIVTLIKENEQFCLIYYKDNK